ncbi:MAG TPA: MEDS domain-containing protein [Mycobacteriales bacterium]|nr:MEDS domain-containing protein [Mycobacteriales bacterium]
MRVTGVAKAARGYDHHDHLCWAFDELGEFHSRVLEFLTDGLAQGQRACYAATSDTAALWDDLRDLEETNRARRPGAVQVQSLDNRYVTGTVVDPVGRLQEATAVTEDALGAGFTGLRLACEAAPLMRTPEQLDAYVRFEHLIDRYMTSQPLSVLCAYNRVELGEQTIAQVACMHPATNDGAAPFRLHASTRAAASLGGDLDLASFDLFLMALRWADLRPTGGELVIDATELEFIDHRSLLALAEHAWRCDATAVLQTGLPSTAQMIKVLDLADVRVEVPI